MGVIVLECLCGKTPFPSGEDNSPSAVLDSIAPFARFCTSSREADALPPSFCSLLTRDARLLIRGLLHTDERCRWEATRQLRQLGFFAGVDWERLSRRQVEPPLKPTLVGA